MTKSKTTKKYNKYLLPRTDTMEVLNGAQIDRHLFSEKIAEAKLSRLETNRNFNQCIALQGCGASNS